QIIEIIVITEVFVLKEKNVELDLLAPEFLGDPSQLNDQASVLRRNDVLLEFIEIIWPLQLSFQCTGMCGHVQATIITFLVDDVDCQAIAAFIEQGIEPGSVRNDEVEVPDIILLDAVLDLT